MIHENSALAYGIQRAFNRNRRAFILDFFQRHGPATDREVMMGLGFIDMDQVRPRITELVAAGLACEVGGRLDPLTGKTVRVVRAALV